MDNQEVKNQEGLPLNKDTQINLVMSSLDSEESTVDLGRVFRNFKARRRIYAWLLLFCIVAGISAALLMYQVTKAPLTVRSVVTLRYKIEWINKEDPDSIIRKKVGNLTSPDGKTELDLTQITSAYVLNNALENITLSAKITPAILQSNITIEKILTEESRQAQALINSMMQNSNTMSAAYERAQNVEPKYTNQFIVSLRNGFGDEENGLIYLKDSELSLLLDRILYAYNEYLVETYAPLKVPDDEISVIAVEDQDLIENLDLLSTAMTNLSNFCDEQVEEVKTYRSWKTGLTLEELKQKVDLVRSVNLDYLYAYVYTNNIANEPEAVRTRYEYDLRSAQTSLEEINEKIAETNNILTTYKNDDVFVSMQESDSTRSTKFTTDYYNGLIMAQAENYKTAAELQTTISDLEKKIAGLSNAQNTEKIEEASEEFAKALETSYKAYLEVAAHIEEILASSLHRNFAEASAAQGKTESFISASAKNMAVFGAVGAIIALVLWFFSALMPEFHHRDHDEEEKKNSKMESEGVEA